MEPNTLAQLSRFTTAVKEKAAALNATIEQYEAFQADYRALADQLSTFSHQLSYDVQIPMGPLAFMPGSIVHTNEVMVLLGDNWFVERSAHQAQAIATRRVAYVEDIIEKIDDSDDESGGDRTTQARAPVAPSHGSLRSSAVRSSVVEKSLPSSLGQAEQDMLDRLWQLELEDDEEQVYSSESEVEGEEHTVGEMKEGEEVEEEVVEMDDMVEENKPEEPQQWKSLSQTLDAALATENAALDLAVQEMYLQEAQTMTPPQLSPIQTGQSSLRSSMKSPLTPPATKKNVSFDDSRNEVFEDTRQTSPESPVELPELNFSHRSNRARIVMLSPGQPGGSLSTGTSSPNSRSSSESSADILERMRTGRQIPTKSNDALPATKTSGTITPVTERVVEKVVEAPIDSGDISDENDALEQQFLVREVSQLYNQRRQAMAASRGDFFPKDEPQSSVPVDQGLFGHRVVAS
ncbi:hypothetical protein BJ085DRAFT_27451 [Dimargaris cristalligena]|uniref:DUF3835 domain-containing protein n=1 Tax=Dimargaris cristalligena TaxID=215637 RepID=A0A4P9ZWK6_9FUNG|nr:hypothetical protein BJ085DRAFT_27451 [Dimargaris cristalligena]|eukprot:RKP37070.1 hypothetical protein BJ085DRAFT_27451 [Dimargaris cristalligena]